MTSDIHTIRKKLEETFDIPFVVHLSCKEKEPVFSIAPVDPGKELFILRVSFRNKVRLIMDFIPQKYSVGFIRSMGEKSLEDKTVFAAYYELMRHKGAKGMVRVNGLPVEPADISSWPADWHSFEARITRMPIHENGDLIYAESVNEWGSLMMGMILSLADIVPVETENEINGFCEGDLRRVETNRYERNPLNRKLCLAVKGYRCSICDFDFEETYGKLGHGFIHVHHIIPVSRAGFAHMVDPVNDLIPVCPNCHAMLHRSDPPLQPVQLRKIIDAGKKETVYRYGEYSSQESRVAVPETAYGGSEEAGNGFHLR